MKVTQKLLLLTSAMVAGVALPSFADEQVDSMKVALNSGSDHVSFVIDDVSKITFSGDNMVVATTSGTSTIAIDDIDEITFDLVLTSIDNIDADLGDNIAFNIDGGLATVVRADGGDIYVAVYSLQGALLKRVAAKASATVDLNALSSGMYIIKANQKVIKLKK